jgi:hypothetical protein
MKYPSGPISQHKSLATGAGLTKAPSGNSGRTGFEKQGSAKEGKIRKSGTSTGSSSGKSGY